jgi:hypothetical protein
MMAIVWSSISAAIASRSAVVVPGSTGATRSSMPNRWQALSKAGWPVSGFTKLGRVMPRCWAACSRYDSRACMMLPVPPVVTSPAGSVAVMASPWNRSNAMAMISPSNRVALGHMSRCSALTWANRPNDSFMKS